MNASHDSNDPFELERFVKAQDGSYETALAEVRAAAASACIGCGTCFRRSRDSGTARRRSIMRSEVWRRRGRILAHPLLKRGLIESVEAVLTVPGRSAQAIFGSPDDLKLRSCATLFAQVSVPRSVFERLLDRYFDGERDPRTLELLKGA